MERLEKEQFIKLRKNIAEIQKEININRNENKLTPIDIDTTKEKPLREDECEFV